MGDRVHPDTAPDTAPPGITSSPREPGNFERRVEGSPPNTTVYSAGAVCCPTESSARRHDRAGWRATWWDADAPPRYGYPALVTDLLTGAVTVSRRIAYGPVRRWTR